jgi:hypothetical protein
MTVRMERDHCLSGSIIAISATQHAAKETLKPTAQYDSAAWHSHGTQHSDLLWWPCARRAHRDVKTPF